MLYYVIVEPEFKVTMYMEYITYKDIIRYYDITNELSKHECVINHYTLGIF